MDICFLDTETLGLHPDAPVWEFAAIRRRPDGSEEDFHCYIDHDEFVPGNGQTVRWIDDLPDSFADDYRERFSPAKALNEPTAAALIYAATRGATIVGAVPSFDTERLSQLLRRNGIEPPWHYHLMDVENLVLGYLHGVAARVIDEARMRGDEPDPALTQRNLGFPLKSDDLSRAVGVDPDEYARHSAMGDVAWARAQWDAVTECGKDVS